MAIAQELDENSKKSITKILKIAGEPSIIRLTGDASDRSYFRVIDRGKSFVAMKMKKGFNSPAEEITKSLKKIDELPFLNVQKFLRSLGSPVPDIVGVDPEAGIIVLEDLGDRSLYSALPQLTRDEIKKTYEDLVCALVDFQIPRDGSPDCIAFYRKYDLEMTNWELDHFLEWGIEAFLGLKVDPDELREIKGCFSKIAKTFLAEPFVFSHRDYHSKNIMLTKGSFKIIDFQDALLAPVQYDLASLLRDSYVTLDAALLDELTGFYLKTYKDRSKRKISSEKFRKGFDFVSMHRNLKAAGRFVFIEKKKSNPGYIPYIPRTVGYVADNLSKYPEFKSVKGTFSKYFDMINEKIDREYRRD